jgi:hypothetical protein
MSVALDHLIEIGMMRLTRRSHVIGPAQPTAKILLKMAPGNRAFTKLFLY